MKRVGFGSFYSTGLTLLFSPPRLSRRPGMHFSYSHGMRNEMSHSKEVALDRSLLHPWLRGGASPRSSTNNGRREAGFVIKRHTILALLIHERGIWHCVEKASLVTNSSFG